MAGPTLKPKEKEILFSKPRTVLDEVQGVMKERQKDYAPPKENFERIAALWSVVLGVPVTSKQVALCMIQTKVAREMHASKRDNLVDIIGYATCMEQL